MSLVATKNAHAQSAQDAVPASSVALNWVRMPGAESCSAPQTLARMVSARVGGAVFVAVNEADWAIEGRIERRGRAWVATLSAARMPGEVGTRVIERVAPDCAAIDEQIITVIALLLDANRVRPQPPTQPAQPAQCPTPPEPRIVTREVRVPVVQQRTVMIQPVPSRVASIELGLGGAFARTIGPSFAAHVAGEWAVRWPLLRLRAGLYFDGPVLAEVSWESTSTTLTTLATGASLALCVASPHARWLSLCPGAHVGVAVGTATGADTAVLGAVSLALAVRAELPLTNRWALRAWTEASASLLQPRFAVIETNTNRVIAETVELSPIALSSGVAISLLFGSETR
ncbi:MAG: hypothetical protein JNK05_11940 [Myxococcales bacterium]|nr:hypothetical protein [Myxococcales bacterium]